MKVGLVSLGCPKNLVDSEIMLGLMQSGGFELENDLNKTDIMVVNTCGFIHDAKEESINKILEVAELKKTAKCKALIVTGCLAERYSEDIIDQIKEVDAVLGSASYGEIVNTINKILYSKERHFTLIKPQTDIDWLENERVVTTNQGSAYLKISEGCDNRCTYCIIPSLRGPFRSRELTAIVLEANKLAQQGVKEIILVGQDTTRYGIDIYKKPKLIELIRALSLIEGIEWIRLLYCYPEMVSYELIDEIVSNKKVCKYIDIPMQHASNSILKLMGRKTNAKNLKDLVKRLRSKGRTNKETITIRSTFIVGFPGETDEDIEELKKFIEKSKLDRVGVFMYSKEEGTPAAKFKNQVSKSLKKSRHDTLMEIQRGITLEIESKKIGKTLNVLVENVAEDGIFYFGRSQFEAPEIDNMIYFTSQWPLKSGQMVDVKILNTDEYDLIGEVTYEPSK